MAIQSNFPAIKPSLLLDFANTKQLDPRITFTRASTATFYDGVTTAKAEENLLLQSQTFDNASWTKSNTAVSGTDTIVAPDGTTTAEEVRDGTATNIHSCFQSVTLASGTTYVASVFLKNVDRQYAILAVSGGVAAYASAKFDLTGGTSTANQAAGAGWSVTSATITSVGSGWYRCVLVFVSGTGGSCNFRVGTASDGTTFTTNGSGLESYTGTDLKIAVWGAQFEQRSSVTAYTATTAAPITNYIPVLQTAASGVARFDHNPTTFESLGLEIEESRTNLLTYSEQFDNAAWIKTQSSIVSDTVVAPTGLLTGDLHLPNTTAAEHSISQNFSFVSGTTYTLSIYLKAAGYTQCRIRFQSSAFGGSAQSIDVDLVAGTAVVASGAVIPTITNVGNGWYRVTSTATAATTISAAISVFPIIGGSTTGAGDGYSGIYIWGAQLEAGAFATSYIPTVASQVTRAADAASMTGTNFSSWFSNMQSTLYAEAQTFANTSSPTLVSINTNAASTLGIGVFVDTSGTRWNLRVRGSADSSVVASYTGQAVNALNKAVIGYNQNSLSTSVTLNAASPTTATRGPVVADQLTIGSNTTTASNSWNGHIRKIAYYPLRVTNAQLQALTS